MDRVYVVTCLEHQRDKAAAFGVEGVADCKDGATKILDALFHRKCDIYGVKELNAYEHYTEGEDFLIGEQDFACIGCIREINVQHNEDFPVLSVQRADLEQKGFDTSNLGDEWMEKIASKAGDILLDGDYWDAVEYAAEHYNVPRKSEEPTIIEADIAGYMVKFPDSDEVFYVGSSCPPIGNGVCYKSKKAFDDQQGICYTPEHDFKDISAWRDLDCDSELQERLANYLGTHELDSGHVALDVGYTWDDLRERVYSWIGDKLNDVCDDKYFELFVDYIQERLFNELDWQGPDALLYAWDVMELYDDAPQLCSDDPRLTDKQKQELGY